MSTSKIELNFTWNLESFLKASEINYRDELFNSNRKFIGWILIALTQFGVVAALKQDSYALLLFSTIILVYWYYGRWFFKKMMIKRSFQSIDNKEFNISLSPHEISVNDTKLDVKFIRTIKELKEGFVIYLNKKNIYLPKYAFNGDESHYFKRSFKEYFV